MRAEGAGFLGHALRFLCRSLASRRVVAHSVLGDGVTVHVREVRAAIVLGVHYLHVRRAPRRGGFIGSPLPFSVRGCSGCGMRGGRPLGLVRFPSLPSLECEHVAFRHELPLFGGHAPCTFP